MLKLPQCRLSQFDGERTIDGGKALEFALSN